MSIANQNDKPLSNSNPDEMYERMIAEHLRAQNDIEFGGGHTRHQDEYRAGRHYFLGDAVERIPGITNAAPY